MYRIRRDVYWRLRSNKVIFLRFWFFMNLVLKVCRCTVYLVCFVLVFGILIYLPIHFEVFTIVTNLSLYVILKFWLENCFIFRSNHYLVTPCPVQWSILCSSVTGIIFFLTTAATINPLYVLCVCVNIMHTCTTLALTKSLFLCLNILVSKNCSFSGLCVTKLFKAVWKEILYETHFVLRGSWTIEKLKILEKWDGFIYQRNLALFCISHLLNSRFVRETSIRAEVHQHFLEGGSKVLNLHKLHCRSFLRLLYANITLTQPTVMSLIEYYIHSEMGLNDCQFQWIIVSTNWIVRKSNDYLFYVGARGWPARRHWNSDSRSCV